MITQSAAESLSLQRLGTLHPDFAEKADAWFHKMREAGKVFLVVEGFRTLERQQELYDQGRETPGRPCRHDGSVRSIGACEDHPMGLICTKAMPGQSFHNYGHAFDWVPLRTAEKAMNMFEADYDNTKEYDFGVQVALTQGMRPLSWETGHLEDDKYADWRELKQSFQK